MTDLPDYDAGLLNDWGGGNVEWWQDYIRAEIGRANDHWRESCADLIPRADAELAVAEAIRRAAEIGADIAQRTRPDGFPEEASNAYHSGAMDVVDAIRALITEKPHDRA